MRSSNRRLFAAGFLTVTGLGSLGLEAPPVRAQVVLLSDNFERADPCASGEWQCNDDARWVAPTAPSCPQLADDPTIDPDHSVDSPGDLQCNLFIPGEGYVLLTPDLNGKRGSIFRKTKSEYRNFKLTAEVELRGGHPKDVPGEGMCIVIVAGGQDGFDSPPRTGVGGGGMGAVGMGDYPHMIFEFDNDGEHGSDNVPPAIPRDNNHIGFTWSPHGFCSLDDIAKDLDGTGSDCRRGNDVFRHVDTRLNGVELDPRGTNQSGKYLFEAFIHEGTVACDLTNLEAGLSKTRMYAYKIPDFEPFEGFLGVTAVTGGTNQNHILHSVKVEALPEDFCLEPIPQDPDLCPPRFHRGDVDTNGRLQLTDAIRLLGIVFQELPLSCYDSADADGNNQIQLTDAIRILGYLFLGGIPPAPPGPPPNPCGRDNDGIHLGCTAYNSCGE